MLSFYILRVITKVIGLIIQVLQYADISCNGAKMYLVIFVLLICVIVLKVSPDVVDIRVCCCLPGICCVYIYN